MESIILFLDFSLSFIAEYWSHLDKDVEHDEVGLGVVQDGLHHRAVVLKKIMIMQSMLTSWCLDYLAFKVNSDLFIILKSKIFQNDPKERLKCELIFLTLENNNLRIHCHPSIKSDMGQHHSQVLQCYFISNLVGGAVELLRQIPFIIRAEAGERLSFLFLSFSRTTKQSTARAFCRIEICLKCCF